MLKKELAEQCQEFHLRFQQQELLSRWPDAELHWQFRTAVTACKALPNPKPVRESHADVSAAGSSSAAGPVVGTAASFCSATADWSQLARSLPTSCVQTQNTSCTLFFLKLNEDRRKLNKSMAWGQTAGLSYLLEFGASFNNRGQIEATKHGAVFRPEPRQ